MKINHVHLPFHIVAPSISGSQLIKFTPYSYQLDAVCELKNVTKAILSLPCGMGKSHTSVLIANEYDNIIIMAPLRELTNDLLKTFSNQLGNDYTTILISCDGIRDINLIKTQLKKRNIIASTFKSVDILQLIIEPLNNKIITVLPRSCDSLDLAILL